MESDLLRAILQAKQALEKFANSGPERLCYVSHSTMERLRQSPDYTISPAGRPLFLVEGPDGPWWAMEVPNDIYDEWFPDANEGRVPEAGT